MTTYTVRASSMRASYIVGEFRAATQWEAIAKAKTLLARQGNFDMLRWRFDAWA